MPFQFLNTETTTLLLAVLLIASFIIAFKIMKMVFETITASAVSGAFYVALAYTLNFPLTLERVLLFAFIGATLYMLYSFLISAYTIVEKILEIPYRIIKTLLGYIHLAGKKVTSYFREKRKLKQLQQKEHEATENVKKVVTNKVKEEDEEN